MKRLMVLCVVLLAIALIAPPVFAKDKMVDSQTRERTIKRLQRISDVLSSAKNQVGIEQAAIEADIAAHADRFEADDITALQTLFPYMTTVKNEITNYETEKNTLFPDMD